MPATHAGLVGVEVSCGSHEACVAGALAQLVVGLERFQCLVVLGLELLEREVERRLRGRPGVVGIARHLVATLLQPGDRLVIGLARFVVHIRDAGLEIGDLLIRGRDCIGRGALEVIAGLLELVAGLIGDFLGLALDLILGRVYGGLDVLHMARPQSQCMGHFSPQH